MVVTGDFHGNLPPDVPACDLLLIVGDVTPVWDHSPRGQAEYLAEEFEPWLERQPAEQIVGVAGNHDFIAEANPGVMRDLPWIYLQDEAAVIDGHLIWGSPRSKLFGGWAFMDTDEDLAKVWATIPDDVEILIVHDPAFGLLDDVGRGHHVGSETLRERIGDLKALKLFACGHIHEGYGTKQLLRPNSSAAPVEAEWITVANGAYVGGSYHPGNPPIEIELEGGKA